MTDTIAWYQLYQLYNNWWQYSNWSYNIYCYITNNTFRLLYNNWWQYCLIPTKKLLKNRLLALFWCRSWCRFDANKKTSQPKILGAMDLFEVWDSTKKKNTKGLKHLAKKYISNFELVFFHQPDASLFFSKFFFVCALLFL